MDQKELNQISDVLQRLTKSRNRTDKKTLTMQERQEMLNRIYDGALYWLESVVITGKTKGVGVATQILERARIEAVELERTGMGDACKAVNNKITIGWAEYGKPDKVANA